MSTWHYADSQQQQRGPVDATWLQAAYGRGEITAATLLWREGMAGWKPLAELAGELGIAVAAPPRLPPQFAAAGGRAQTIIVAPRDSSGWLVGLVIGGVVLIAFLGILAAIAIPAYQDYTVRAKVMEGYNESAPARLAVAEYWTAEERCPRNGEGELEAAERYARGALRAITAGQDEAGRCTLTLEYHGLRPNQRDTLQLAYQDERWVRDGGTIEPRWLPSSLR